MSVPVHVKVNSGMIPAKVIKVNNKTVIVEVSKDIMVKVPAVVPEGIVATGKKEFTLEPRTITKHIKRQLSDLQAI